jgi:hypothetical protein
MPSERCDVPLDLLTHGVDSSALRPHAMAEMFGVPSQYGSLVKVEVSRWQPAPVEDELEDELPQNSSGLRVARLSILIKGSSG